MFIIDGIIEGIFKLAERALPGKAFYIFLAIVVLAFAAVILWTWR